jgi:hypothetical protein
MLSGRAFVCVCWAHKRSSSGRCRREIPNHQALDSFWFQWTPPLLHESTVHILYSIAHTLLQQPTLPWPVQREAAVNGNQHLPRLSRRRTTTRRIVLHLPVRLHPQPPRTPRTVALFDRDHLRPLVVVVPMPTRMRNHRLERAAVLLTANDGPRLPLAATHPQPRVRPYIQPLPNLTSETNEIC